MRNEVIKLNNNINIYIKVNLKWDGDQEPEYK